MKVGLSLVPAYVLGWIIGPALYNFSICWGGGGTDCPAYSPVGIVVSYLLSWPVFLLGSLLEKYAHMFLSFGTFNPFAPEFALLWLYYYLLVWAADYLAMRLRRKTSAPLKANQ